MSSAVKTSDAGNNAVAPAEQRNRSVENDPDLVQTSESTVGRAPVSEERLLQDQVDLLYQQAHSAALFTLANGCILVIALYPVVDLALLLGWLALLVSVTLARGIMTYRYEKLTGAQRDPIAWRNRYFAGAVAAGACWGLAGTALFPDTSPVHQVITLIVVAGMSAGAISFQAAVLRVYVGYATMALIPLALWLITQRTETHALIGVLTLVFFASLLATCRRIHGNLTESLRLRYENRDLVDNLADSKRELQGLNRRLQGEIAEHTRTENELRDSYQFLKRIMDNTTNAIYVLDLDGNFIHTNHVTCETTGYDRDELFRSPFTGLFQEHDRGGIREKLEQVARAGDTVTHYEIDLVEKDGTRRSLSLNLAPLYEGERISSIVGTAEDITERRKVEKLKSEFLSTVSHELRTPLTSIRGSLGLLHGGVQDLDSGEARQLIDIAYKNTDRLINLINDLLDIQKLEAGEMNFSFETYDLETLLEHAIEINHGLAEEYKVGFAFDTRVAGIQVRVDKNRFEQVLTNLLSNAVKFSPKGSEVCVAMERADHRIRVAITDRGPGIPEDFQHRIFQKFAQADGSNTRQKGGTGLGLSITKGMLERMGGSIDFRSECGEGTTFFLELPLAGPADPSRRASERAPA